MRHIFILTLIFTAPVLAQRGAPQGPPPTPQAAAAIDLTGQWVAVVSEDWRHRMMPPRKGDFESVPLNPEGRKVATAWDPARDQAAGEQCRAYGAPGVMRLPTRVRIAWENPTTMRVDLDAGMQTRRFHFALPQGQGAPSLSRGGAAPSAAAPSWQGRSAAAWEYAGRRAPRGGEKARGGSLKVVTTGVRPGYLRKNGVPYSANVTVTEHYNVVRGLNDDQFLVITTIVDDPQYLTQPFITSTNFRKQRDQSGWNPTPCSTT
jgi:hypothetical protein